MNLNYADPIEIGSKILLHLVSWKGKVVPDTVFVQHDAELDGPRDIHTYPSEESENPYRSTRVYQLPAFHNFVAGRQIKATVRFFFISPELTKDGRKRIFIGVCNPQLERGVLCGDMRS